MEIRQRPSEVTPTPKGTIRVNGEDTSAAFEDDFVEIVSYTPEDGTLFSIAKILVSWSGTDEQHIKVVFDSEGVPEELAYYHATGYVMDWFAAGITLAGDGYKKVAIMAMAAGDTGVLVKGFIAGELS